MGLDKGCPAGCCNCNTVNQETTIRIKREKTVALVGQPNTGKSTLFNMLTGANQHVGNWPGITVEKKEGQVQQGDKVFHLYDLPGTYSLTANSLEERIARDFILQERPDVVVVVVDATQLERSLYMVAEIALLRVPMVIALNKMDLAGKEGYRLCPESLALKTKQQVIPISAASRDGIGELLDAIVLSADEQIPPFSEPDVAKAFGQQNFSQLVRYIRQYLPPQFPETWVALKLLEGDREIHHLMQGRMGVEPWQLLINQLLPEEEAMVIGAEARFRWVEIMQEQLISIRPVKRLRKQLDIAATHPLWGKAIALTVLMAGIIAAYIIAIPLMIPGFVIFFSAGFIQDELGRFAPEWFAMMIADGFLGGVSIGAIIMGFIGGVFFVLGLLENTGYLARLAYIFDPFMRRIGLHGKSIMPLMMGFICNILGVAGSRIIDTWKQRLATLVITPIIPCKGLFLVTGFICAVFFGGRSLPIFIALAAVTLLYISFTSLLLQNSVLKGEGSGIIMELPPYHWPSWRNVIIFTRIRMKAFYSRGFWLIVICSLLTWFGIYFPNGTIETSYLAWIGKKLEFFGQVVGWDWRFCVTFLVAFFSKEATLGAMAVIFGASTSADTDIIGIAMDKNLWEYIRSGDFGNFLATTGITEAGALAFIFAVFFSLPCFGTLGMIYTETKSVKWTMGTLTYYFTMSVIMGYCAYRIGLLVFS